MPIWSGRSLPRHRLLSIAASHLARRGLSTLSHDLGHAPHPRPHTRDAADTARLLAADVRRLWHPYTSATKPVPCLPVSHAAGVTLTLEDGRQLVDGMSSWWAAVHGYAVPELDAAASAQLGAMSHVMFGGLTHRPAVQLAELLVDVTPAPLQRVFLCDSGSVSVEVAIKMALQYWRARGIQGRSRLLTVRGGYHGDTFGAMAVCDPVNGMHAEMFGGVLPKHLFAPRPAPLFGQPCSDADVADLAALLRTHAHEVAAVILEPIVQGAGGMHFYSADYLRRVRQLCDEHGVLLILDCIATGFGRTGTLFACEHAGIAPDIMCIGKALTGGYVTMGAALATDEVAEGASGGPDAQMPVPLMHGPTFMANPLSCAIAHASVRYAAPRERRLGDPMSAGRQLLAPPRPRRCACSSRHHGRIGSPRSPPSSRPSCDLSPRLPPSRTFACSAPSESSRWWTPCACSLRPRAPSRPVAHHADAG